MSFQRFRLRSALLAGAASATLMIAVPPVVYPTTAAAAQQVNVSVQFRTALEPYGKWHRHKRWGNVWVPARVNDDWRPYTRGRWVYSDDYGWYWVSADEEADWGWIVFHYGRWVDDDEYGWVWVPGNDWGPAWVDWRRGDDYVGWAPLPPEEVVVDYRDESDYWTFVRPRDLIAPRIHVVILPARQRDVYFRNTVVVNTTVVMRERRFAVNPGIPPAYIAAAYGRPIRTFDVRPRVLAGTARIDGAIEVRSEDLRRNRDRRGRGDREVSVVKETKSVIRPARDIPKAQALGKNEPGRLGDSPPKAARGETTGAPASARTPAADDAAKNARDTAKDAAPDKGKAPTREGRGGATDGRAPQGTGANVDKRPTAAERDRRDGPGDRQNIRRGDQELKKGDRERGGAGARADDKRSPTGQGADRRLRGGDERGRAARPDRSGSPQPQQALPRRPGREERSVDRAPRPSPSARDSGPTPRIDRPAQANRPAAPAMPPAAARRSAQPPSPAARAPSSSPPAARAPAPAARTPSPAPAPAAQAPRPQPSTTGAGGPIRPPGGGGAAGNPR